MSRKAYYLIWALLVSVLLIHGVPRLWSDLRRDSNEEWQFVQYAMAYLSWPRKIETMKLGPNENFKDVLPAQTVVFICGLPTPSTPTFDRTNIAPNLELLRPLDVK